MQRTLQTSTVKSRLTKNFEEVFIRSWWVILFILGCFFGYEQGLMRKDSDFAMLQSQYRDLQQKKLRVLTLQSDLLSQINSQSDPAYVELMLMKGLGLTPEGQTKVLFTELPELLNRQRTSRI